MAKIQCIGFRHSNGIVKVQNNYYAGLKTTAKRIDQTTNDSAKSGEPLGRALAELLEGVYNKRNGADKLGTGV